MNAYLKIKENFSTWYLGFVGMSCVFVGIGIGKFAYAPITPFLVKQGWTTQAGVGYLGTANFLGYFLGVMFSNNLLKYFQKLCIIKYSFFACICCLFLLSANLGFIWLASLRFFIGIAGAFLFVFSPGLILKNIPDCYKGLISGFIFMGSGLGIILSGLFISSLAKKGVMFSWLGSAGITLFAGALSWPALKKLNLSSIEQSSLKIKKLSNNKKIIFLLSCAYGLFGIGAVPNILFLIDYIHRKLIIEPIISGYFWSIFGVGSIVGPLSIGLLSDKIETRKSLLFSFIAASLFISLITFFNFVSLFIISSFLIGAILPSIVLLVSKKILDLVGAESHSIYWGRLTIIYAISQEASSYCMSLLLHLGFRYENCFLISIFAFVLGSVFIWLID